MSLLAQLTRRAYDGVSAALGMEQIAQASVNDSFLALPAAARTATVTSEEQTNLRQRGALVTINVTAAGTGSITAAIQRWDPAAGWVDMLASAALTTDGAVTLTVYPGLTPANNSVASAVLPRLWRVRVAHNNANAITYSVGISTLS